VFILPITDGKEMTWRWEIYKIKNESYNIIVNSNVEDITIYKKQRPGIGDLPSKKPKSLFYKPEYSSGNGTGQIKDIFGQKIFDNPKPLELIKDIIEISTEKDDIILDSFAGTGTTGHAVMKLNKEDDGKRNFILIELEDKVAKRITRERLKKVIKTENYRNGFEFCELDKPLFDKDGKIDQDCSFEDLASYIYFTETKTILDKNKIAKNFIGEHSETKYYLIFRGIGKNTLTTSFLKGLNKESRKIIYADNCTISEDELEQRNIIFKQIPYEVRVF
jgi:adenine specific DNA methylase Mod